MPDQSQNRPEKQTEQEQSLSATDMMRQFLEMNKPKSTDDDHQAHGHTKGAMKLLHKEQRNGRYAMIPANKNSKIYIKECDKHLLHAVMENPDYDRRTGKKLSTPFLQSFSVDDFKRMADPRRENAFHGLTVEIVHDPAANTEEEVKFTKPGISVEDLNEQKTLTENNVHTLNSRDLKIAYSNMFPNESKNTPVNEMRKQIISKIKEQSENKDI